MANSPDTVNVTKYKGTGAVQVFPLLPTQITGTQDGSNVGTGGPGVATLEAAVPTGTFAVNRNIEFLDDRYCLIKHQTAASEGCYKKAQGGAGLWGRVQGGSAAMNGPSKCTGLHVLHPASSPTLGFLYVASTNDMHLCKTTDGTTGASWGTGSTSIESNAASPADYGQSLVFRESVVWAHKSFTGGAGVGSITQYDLTLSTLTRYNVDSLVSSANTAATLTLHVHDNVLFLFGFSGVGNFLGRLMKLQAGSFVSVYLETVQGGLGGTMVGHSAMFTDAATGDLITVLCGQSGGGTTAGSEVLRVQNATGVSPTISHIGSTVMGAVQGADKYLAGNPSANANRRWAINVGENGTFLTTWLAGASTETWEWKGVSAEMEPVSLLAGISDDFALPYNTIGGGHRSPRVAAVEVGDAANPPEEVFGGTKHYFRGRGSTTAGTVTFVGTDSEGTPTTTIPIVAASLTVESGSPPSTPAISGNTITNFTPDNGATLYSIVLNVSAAGVDIGEGDVGTIIAEF